MMLMYVIVKGTSEQFHISNPKRHFLAEKTYNDALCVRMCPKMRHVGVTKKKTYKLACVKLAICPEYKRRRRII